MSRAYIQHGGSIKDKDLKGALSVAVVKSHELSALADIFKISKNNEEEIIQENHPLFSFYLGSGSSFR